MGNDLEAVLNGTDEEETAEVVETTETEEVTASEDTAGEDTTETAAADQTTGEKVDVSPASEPDKRDEAIAGLTAELARVRSQKRELEDGAKKEEERPDFFADPDAAIDGLEARMDRKLNEARLNWSETAAREQHTDFDEKISVFTKMANENPNLWMKMNSQANPAEWAYKQASNEVRFKDIGDIDSFEERIRAEERAKVLTEQSDNIESEIAKRAALPGSLSTQRATGGNSEPPVGDDNLDDVIGVDATHR